MILLHVSVPCEHVKVIRSNIGPESIEKCRDVQNEPISGKKLRYFSTPFFKTPLYFVETENSTFKTYYKYHTLYRLQNIQINFLYILMIIKYSSYNHISKNQKNQPLVKQYSIDLQK
jgi:hypothetical protein